MHFNYRVISEQYRIGSCLIEEIPESYMERLKEQNCRLDRLTMFYYRENDFLILNEQNELYEQYSDLVLTFMSLTKESRHEVLAHTDNDSLYHFLILVEGVIRYRAELPVDEHEKGKGVSDCAEA